MKVVINRSAQKYLDARLVRDGYVIESDLTAEETAILKAGLKEYSEHPENYTEWKPHDAALS